MWQVPEYLYRLFRPAQTLEYYLGNNIDQCEASLHPIVIVIPFQGGKSLLPIKNFILHCMEANRFPELSKVLDRLAFFMINDSNVNNALNSGMNIKTPFYVPKLSHKIERTVLEQMKDSEAWNAVSSCLGEESFCILLLDYIILQRLPNDVFYQITAEKKAKKKVQYKSAFLNDIESSNSSFSEYLNQVFSTRKRPNDKTTRILRRARKKLEIANETYLKRKNLKA
ncbi:hypothetical protein EDC94DRAFT_586597 [Helicostylum pulchrum]|nr:hypothetical protein EDC94DRAFT_586597 [Helicostylum pulchrum]